MRKVIDQQTVSGRQALSGGSTEMPKNWNRRFKHNRDKMKTGNIFELAEVVRNLSCGTTRRASRPARSRCS